MAFFLAISACVTSTTMTSPLDPETCFEEQVRPITKTVKCVNNYEWYNMAYVEWVPTALSASTLAETVPILLVHALTLNGRFMDIAAKYLAAKLQRRVICPDVMGRGKSDRLRNKKGYTLDQYARDIGFLLAAEGISSVDWVGSSLGGYIGIFAASLPGNPIRKLVLNESPVVLPEGFKAYVEHQLPADPKFASKEELTAELRKRYAAMEPISEAQMAHFVKHYAKIEGDGKVGQHYDPAIGANIKELSYWPQWDSISVDKLMVIRGEKTFLFSEDVLAQMQKRGPKIDKLTTVPGVGHAPALLRPLELDPVVEFLK